jgi:solute carrier family 25 citrate transporter 1
MTGEPKYKGMIDGIIKIVRAEGLHGIYKGTLPTVIKQGTNQGIRFLVFDDIKHFIEV